MTRLYKARDLAAMEKEDLWNIYDGDIEVEFDRLPDGSKQVLKADSRPTIFSAYMWRLYVEYPQTPAKVTHHLGNSRLTNKSHLKLMNRVLWDCYDAYEGEVDIEVICKILYEMTNDYYNDFTENLEDEVSTISLSHLFEAIEDPRISKAIDGIDGSPISISHAYDVAEEVWNDPKVLKNNPVSSMVRSKSVSVNQVKQCLIARGRVTDIDSHFFKEPVPNSFLSGMNSLYESMTESRSSSKAMAYKGLIGKSEYLNRRLQLMAATVEGIELFVDKSSGEVVTDCGTDRYIDWFVHAKDLEALDGKYYMDNGEVKVITARSKELVGQSVKLRSPLLCNHPTPQSICSVCYGQMAESIPGDTNIGHVASIAYGERVTQQMLGIKHVDFSMGKANIRLGVYEKKFLEPEMDTRGIKFKNKYRNKQISLSILPDEAVQLAELGFVDDVTTLPVGRVSEISDFYITVTDSNDEMDTVPLNLVINGKKAHMSHELLAYIQKHGYTLSDSGHYVIDLEDFDKSQILFEIPDKDENILDYLASIEQFITSPDKLNSSKKKWKSDNQQEFVPRTLKECRSIKEALVRFHELTSQKILVNLVHLEILIYSTMIRSVNERDYRLPYQGNELLFAQMLKVITSRSLSAAMAGERHTAILLDPETYINDKRPDHPLDDILVPPKAVT